MGIRSESIKIIEGITRLAEAYQKAKGKRQAHADLYHKS